MTKPGIMMMVLVTTALGFYFGGNGFHQPFVLLCTLLGSALTCGGAQCSINTWSVTRMP